MKVVYIREVDAKGAQSWRKVATCETWRQTHEFRTFTKAQQKDNRRSFVFDEHDNLLATP